MVDQVDPRTGQVDPRTGKVKVKNTAPKTTSTLNPNYGIWSVDPKEAQAAAEQQFKLGVEAMAAPQEQATVSAPAAAATKTGIVPESSISKSFTDLFSGQEGAKALLNGVSGFATAFGQYFTEKMKAQETRDTQLAVDNNRAAINAEIDKQRRARINAGRVGGTYTGILGSVKNNNAPTA